MTRTVVHFTDSNGFGGAEQALLILMAGLKRQGWCSVLMYHASPGIAPLIEGAAQAGCRTVARAAHARWLTGRTTSLAVFS